MANQLFADVVIEKKFDSILATKLNLQQFLTVDYSLSENSGMKKKVVVKSAIGDVEDLAMGVGNSGYIEVTTSTKDYDVGVTQGRFKYYDEEAMQDDKVVESGLEGLAETMANDFTTKAVDEWNKASLQQSYAATGISFDDVVSAIAKMNLEDEAGLFMLINPAMQAALRKNLKDDLKYSEGYVRTGYIGSVCGVPVYISKAIPAGIAFLAAKDAVTLFIKKGSEREVERDANVRSTTEYLRKVALVALTDESRVVKIGAAQATAATITTAVKATKVISGAATTGASVQAYVNGVATGSAVIAASSAYSITATNNLAAGDIVKVVASADGCIDSIAEFTVAE